MKLGSRNPSWSSKRLTMPAPLQGMEIPFNIAANDGAEAQPAVTPLDEKPALVEAQPAVTPLDDKPASFEPPTVRVLANAPMPDPANVFREQREAQQSPTAKASVPSRSRNKPARRRIVLCPQCRGPRARPATLKWWDHLFRLARVTPHRCLYCGHRFYKWGAPASTTAEAAGAGNRTPGAMGTDCKESHPTPSVTGKSPIRQLTSDGADREVAPP